MDIYLTIMVTVLVATQVIRVTQNFIQLKRLEKRMGTSSIDKLSERVEK
jgi:hypothetical protein